ncbi:V-type ATPase subunit [Kribbella sp. VKM Ac-2566]|uniref:V0D/AC39 family V-type ATPase subunit n=1 Tax=Kribbella sp. VKM Ac-2566 TaxID=2512218 RepID=UPI00106312DA|nr:V-type ATPase subunit [Kribbella sp. VKM Ac-2566]TDW79519.1 vacuolar-type H+-ATPase subunit C/Vma6 [Kribbella sp. VKM Ac-2566]
MTPRPDFITGNTRLRARLPALLGPVDYDQLAGVSGGAVAERLAASSAYRAYLNRDQGDDRQLLDSVGRRLRDLLRGVRGLYGGIAGAAVGVLLARHDLQDALALLRGARTGQPAAVRLAAVMGVGAIDQRAAADIAAASDGTTAVIRMATHRLPDTLTARALPAAWERYELTGDSDEFETTIAAAAIDGWTDRLEWIGRAARPVLELIQAECDRANLLAVLRDPALQTPRLLPAGLVPEPALLAARRGDPQPAIATYPNWRQPLERHLHNKDLPALEWDLDVQLWRQAVRGLRRGDPLGATVPVGYVLAAECEARTIRLLLAGTAQAHDVRDLLVP